jgi:hypothetical protein
VEKLSKNVRLILHEECQLLDYGESRTSGPYLKLRLKDPELLSPFRGLDVAGSNKSGHILNVTITEGDLAHLAEEMPEDTKDRPFGQQARELKLSGFFRSPDVWKQVGSDTEFLDWIRRQPDCCASKVDPNEPCAGIIVAAHVRRVADGSGMGIKPPYSAIPLCEIHHANQHAQGESSVGPREWWDKQRIHWVSSWAWEELKHQLGYGSWSQVPPKVLLAWAENQVR